MVFLTNIAVNDFGVMISGALLTELVISRL